MQTNLTVVNQKATNTMTSLEIAGLTNKLHKHVMRDLRELIDAGSITESNYGLSNYQDASGKNNPMYELDFTATMILITGYDANRRALIIKRWVALETGEVTPAYQSGINVIIADHIEATLRVAKIFGLEGNQALLSTNHAVREATGVDCMAMLNINGFVKEDKTQFFTPTILGKKIGVSAVRVNQMLKQAGLQVEERDHRNNLIWNVTEAGKPLCEMIDTNKKYNNGAPIMQVKWSEEVLNRCQSIAA